MSPRFRARMIPLALASALAATTACAQPAPTLAELRARPPEQDVIYLIMPDRFANADPSNDRGGLKGDKLHTGFDPADKAFYHGGDLKGVTAHLDYIRGLGANAIWLTPVLVNKPVQGAPGHESAGYHGYWITDFTHVDPHLGTDADFAALVAAAHARGIKVYMDIVVNHTADVIQYREGPATHNLYRSLADYPFSRRGGMTGAPINPGFAGDQDPSPANWARMTDPTFAYTPYVPAAEAHVKQPEWLNDPIWYHNRGDSTFKGESANYGDFSGLDDLATENPRVVAGFIAIYGAWIDRFGIDGFRIDTAKHVNPAFWRAFVPAMQARARADGIPNFHIFGEVMTGDYDPALTAQWTRNAGLPAIMDYPFMRALLDAAGGKTLSEIVRTPADDALYAESAIRLPTFVGNYDVGRVGWLIARANPGIAPAELAARVRLAHAMLLTLRGVPVIYYGDEQGLIGSGDDQAARQDMFASRTPSYNAEPVLTGAPGARDRFDRQAPLYRFIADLARVRAATPALTAGRTVVRAGEDAAGLLALSRFDPATGREVLLAFNTATTPIHAAVAVDPASARFTALAGACPASATAPGSAMLDLPPLGFAICAGAPQ